MFEDLLSQILSLAYIMDIPKDHTGDLFLPAIFHNVSGDLMVFAYLTPIALYSCLNGIANCSLLTPIVFPIRLYQPTGLNYVQKITDPFVPTDTSL